MIKKELYDKTVSILVDAYFKDTLQHQNCFACAVGNLIAANMKIKYADEKYKGKRVVWVGLEDTKVGVRKTGTYYISGEIQSFIPNGCLEQLNSTGYTLRELHKIENAFESKSNGMQTDAEMFNGLMAVIDVLDEIHENKDTEATQTTKNRFKKELA